MKTDAQIVAVSWKLVRQRVWLLGRGDGGQRTIQMPAWAIIAVPGGGNVSICCIADLRRENRCTEDQVKLDAFSIFLRGITCSAEEGFVFSPPLGCGVLLWDACC